MANKVALISQIRFQLDQLTVRNGFHDFEHLCRHLARQNIANNILPATGPVSGGGDQGRDFETYRTFIARQGLGARSFAAHVDDSIVAFACTLERKATLPSKIREDVSTIVSSGTPIRAIYAFCADDLSVSKRHELQQWSSDTHHTRLDILDGQAISEALAESDVFWIAERYLGIPSEMYPKGAETDYAKLIARWRTAGDFALTHSNLLEIRLAARRSTDHPEHSLFWDGLLRRFLEGETPLRRRAIYELGFLAMRTSRPIDGLDDLMREYFVAADSLQNMAEIEDAGALHTLCVAAVLKSSTQLSASEVDSWKQAIVSRVDYWLKSKDTGPNFRCALLEERGVIEISPRLNAPQAQFRDALQWWALIPERLDDAPLFPLLRFARRLEDFTSLHGNDPDVEAFAVSLDGAISLRSGSTETSRLSLTRALSCFKSGSFVRAIGHANKARTGFFAHETLGPAIAAMILMSQSYRALGMTYAAKHHALAAAKVASTNDLLAKYMATALVEAAESDYLAGAFFGFLDLAQLAAKAYLLFCQTALTAEVGRELERILPHVVFSRAIAAHFDAQLQSAVELSIRDLPIKLSDFYPEDFLTVDSIKKFPHDQLWKNIESQLWGPPFSDAGPERHAEFRVRGVHWTVSWTNDIRHTRRAELTLSFLQILAIEFAKEDFCFLPSPISIIVECHKTRELSHSESFQGVMRTWHFNFPDSPPSEEEVERTLFLKIVEMFVSVALVPPQKITDYVRSNFERLVSLLPGVQRHDDLRALFSGSLDHVRISVVERPLRSRKFVVREHEASAALTTPGPNFEAADNLANVRRRYDAVVSAIPFTLKALASSPEFRNTYKQLRSEGWLDWHVYTAIYTICLSFRAEQLAAAGTTMVDSVAQAPSFKESVTSAPPTAAFGAQSLTLARKANMVATAQLFGLCIPHGPVDLEALEKILADRYEYWHCDVDHPPLL